MGMGQREQRQLLPTVPSSKKGTTPENPESILKKKMGHTTIIPMQNASF